MKGIIFNLFETFITDEFGEDKFDEILESTELITKDPFVGPGTYPDADLLALVSTTTKILNISTEDALRAFGKDMFYRLVEKYPMFVAGIEHPKEFLLSVEDVIHVEVRKLYPEAETPRFLYQEPTEGSLLIEYQSKRNLCHLMEGLLDGTAKHFKRGLDYKQTKCIHQGDEICLFSINFDTN